jgi:hypothetical protein
MESDAFLLTSNARVGSGHSGIADRFQGVTCDQALFSIYISSSVVHILLIAIQLCEVPCEAFRESICTIVLSLLEPLILGCRFHFWMNDFSQRMTLERLKEGKRKLKIFKSETLTQRKCHTEFSVTLEMLIDLMSRLNCMIMLSKDMLGQVKRQTHRHHLVMI